MYYEVTVKFNTAYDKDVKKKFTGKLAKERAVEFAAYVALHGYECTKPVRYSFEQTRNTVLYIYPVHRIYSIIVEKIDG